MLDMSLDSLRWQRSLDALKVGWPRKGCCQISLNTRRAVSLVMGEDIFPSLAALSFLGGKYVSQIRVRGLDPVNKHIGTSVLRYLACQCRAPVSPSGE